MSGKTIQIPSSVIKRSGQTAPFDGDKIRSAIERAGKAAGAFDVGEAQLLAIQALKVTLLSSAEACKKLVRRALENFRLPYITITPTFSICPKHGYLSGEHIFCPECDEELIARKQQVAHA